MRTFFTTLFTLQRNHPLSYEKNLTVLQFLIEFDCTNQHHQIYSAVVKDGYLIRLKLD